MQINKGWGKHGKCDFIWTQQTRKIGLSSSLLDAAAEEAMAYVVGGLAGFETIGAQHVLLNLSCLGVMLGKVEPTRPALSLSLSHFHATHCVSS